MLIWQFSKQHKKTKLTCVFGTLKNSLTCDRIACIIETNENERNIILRQWMNAKQSCKYGKTFEISRIQLSDLEGKTLQKSKVQSNSNQERQSS